MHLHCMLLHFFCWQLAFPRRNINVHFLIHILYCAVIKDVNPNKKEIAIFYFYTYNFWTFFYSAFEDIAWYLIELYIYNNYRYFRLHHIYIWYNSSCCKINLIIGVWLGAFVLCLSLISVSNNVGNLNRFHLNTLYLLCAYSNQL